MYIISLIAEAKVPSKGRRVITNSSTLLALKKFEVHPQSTLTLDETMSGKESETNKPYVFTLQNKTFIGFVHQSQRF